MNWLIANSITNPPSTLSTQWSIIRVMVLLVFSNCWMNSGVHYMTHSSFQHFWKSTSFARHSWSSVANVTKKIRRPLWKCTYSSTSLPSTSCCDSLLPQILEPVFQTTLQFLSSQASSTLLEIPDPSLKILPVPTTKPSVGSRGPDPGSEVKFFQQTPILLALSTVTCLHRSKSHSKQYGWVLEPGFCTLREKTSNSNHSKIIQSTNSELVRKNFND